MMMNPSHRFPGFLNCFRGPELLQFRNSVQSANKVAESNVSFLCTHPHVTQVRTPRGRVGNKGPASHISQALFTSKFASLNFLSDPSPCLSCCLQAHLPPHPLQSVVVVIMHPPTTYGPPRKPMAMLLHNNVVDTPHRRCVGCRVSC
jgi:hypothetical protein